MNKIEKITADLNRVLHSDTYQFEIDTEDLVLGFKRTLKKRTNSLAKAIKLKAKLTKDCGRFLSSTVRITAVRFYKNGELTKEITAKASVSTTYNE